MEKEAKRAAENSIKQGLLGGGRGTTDKWGESKDDLL